MAFVATTTFLLAVPLPFEYAVAVINDAILGVALTHAFAALILSLVHLKLVTVVEGLVAHVRLLVCIVCISGPLLLLLGLRLALKGLLGQELIPRILVQIVVEGLSPVEVFVRLRNHCMAVVLNLPNLFKVLL